MEEEQKSIFDKKRIAVAVFAGLAITGSVAVFNRNESETEGKIISLVA
jgi:hypothetical protein